MREKVLRYIRERGMMRAGDRVAVAVSGGADSVALLRVLLELRADLGIVLAVAHFNHGQRGEESNADEAFVAELAKQHGLEFFVGRGDVRDHAFTSKLSIEAAGRDLRYRWLTGLAREHRFDAVATAHTLDDQAETVLLKFLRGAGTRGLAAIYPILQFGREESITKTEAARDSGPSRDELVSLRLRVVRPLLSVSCGEVESYLTSLAQTWREDESNLDRRFTRNRVRHDLLPLLEREFNPNIRSVLNDAAEVARAEEKYWQTLVERELALRLKPHEDGQVERHFIGTSQTSHFSHHDPAAAGDTSLGPHAPHCLRLDGFAELPLAVQRRLLKRFAEDAGVTLDFDHVEKLLRCALGDRSRAELPSNWLAERRGECLTLQVLESASASAPGYECVLPVPGEVRIDELGLTVRALTLAEEFAREVTDPSLLNAALIGAELTVRNWRPGDRFRPVHSRSQKKLKRLFAEKHIPAEQRHRWPVALHGAEIVWVLDFPVAHGYRWKGEGEAVDIEILHK